MAPLTPFWAQPSHGHIQEVLFGKEGFTSKSISKIALPPFALFAKMSFPPCTKADEPTYATVQMGRDAHLNLNSDLVYINHSCDPSLIFDMATLSVLAGPRGLRPGEELTFFYPSTEWSMAQAFECFCGTAKCHGKISGAKDMAAKQLEGMWLNGYIRDMLAERDATSSTAQNGKIGVASRNGSNGLDTNSHVNANFIGHSNGNMNGKANTNGVSVPVPVSDFVAEQHAEGSARKGPSSRELSGEMGGDTTPSA